MDAENAVMETGGKVVNLQNAGNVGYSYLWLNSHPWRKKNEKMSFEV
jgi:hypothetical protein